MAPLSTIYYGSLINPESLTSYKALPNCLFSVGPSGNIEWIVDDVAEHALQDTLAQEGCIDVDVVALKSGQFIIPGFIDTHTHAPQFPNIGSGQQYELLDWLNKVTFPMESQFSDLEFARRTYASVVRRVIDCGTTTCCYYGTLHLEATKALADIVNSHGQRAFVGKCNMDRECPDYYVESSSEASIVDTTELIKYIRALRPTSSISLSQSLVQPILTPRFAISCTPKLLGALGNLAASDPSLHIQTHISENKSEIEFTKELFPEALHYAGVYDSFGLLRSNTVLAHAVHLVDAEMELIAQRGAGISHCPTSNFNLSSGVAPIGGYLDRGIKVGLGTDVSGGFSHSMLDSIRGASIASKVVAMRSQQVIDSPAVGKFANRQLSVASLFYLATLGGAQVCDIDKQVGSFAPGKSFDALVISAHGDKGSLGSWIPASDTPASRKQALDQQLEHFLFCGDDRNISRVFVQGRLIGGTAFRK